MKILVAGVGNLLRGDDGFGVRVAQRLQQMPLSPNVRVVEVGISGMSLVHELMEKYDLCIIADAYQGKGIPGTLYLLTPDPAPGLPAEELHQQLVDMHYADPSRVLLLAGALGITPAKVYVVACQPAQLEDLTETLTPAVERAVGEAIIMIKKIIAEAEAGQGPA